MTKRQICFQIDEEEAKIMEKIRDKTGLPISRQLELTLKGYKIIEDNKTSIELSEITIKSLQKINKKNDTYDDTILKLIHELYPVLEI